VIVSNVSRQNNEHVTGGIATLTTPGAPTINQMSELIEPRPPLNQPGMAK
jgi:hypothetical protein